MAQRKQETFTVTDRRLFTADGELRKDVPEEPEQERPVTTKAPAAAPESPAQESSSEQAPELQGPSAAEQQEQAHAYQKSSAEMDRQAEANGISAKRKRRRAISLRKKKIFYRMPFTSCEWLMWK
ncbi:MAG: hypothetical protein AUG89_02160 [Acidobacteria bacterium 13_1_20CM_4_56_7]|nr:MAG: hypothetical protein AUG89_02160 [Acidobacteria bacterium 13_1_20CM_4_56_7]